MTMSCTRAWGTPGQSPRVDLPPLAFRRRPALAFQPTFAPLQDRRQLVPASIGSIFRVLGRACRFRLSEQLLDFLAQLPLFLAHPSVAHGLVLRRVRFDLAAVERDA